MNSIYAFLKTSRLKAGLTQSELSYISGVSLPMIQLIEGGRGNPSIKTVEKILKPLGLRVDINQDEPNWDLLARCGLPIHAAHVINLSPSKKLLLSQLPSALEYINEHLKTSEDMRKLEAVEALLFTIKHDYPSLYDKNLKQMKFSSKYTPQNPSGRHIKLRRIIRSILSTYL